MKSELQQHKKSDSVKWTLTAIALTVVVILLTSLFLQVFGSGKVKPSEWFKKTETEQSEDSALLLSMQESSSSIMLTSYAADGKFPLPELSEYERYVQVTTPNYNGPIVWTVGYFNRTPDAFDSFVERTITVEEKVNYYDNLDWSFSITKVWQDNSDFTRIYNIQCEKSGFSRQVELAVSRADLREVKATCVCDFNQRFYLSEVYIGFNSFLPDGRIGKTPRLEFSPYDGYFLSPCLDIENENSLHCFAYYASTWYTIPHPEAEPINLEGAGFEFVVNEEWVKAWGYEEFNFMSYSGNFDNSIIYDVEHFFDKEWFAYAVSGTEYTVEDFAHRLADPRYSSERKTDNIPAYFLTITGFPESTVDYSYSVNLDYYKLGQFLGYVDLDVDDPYVVE